MPPGPVDLRASGPPRPSVAAWGLRRPAQLVFLAVVFQVRGASGVAVRVRGLAERLAEARSDLAAAGGEGGALLGRGGGAGLSHRAPVGNLGAGPVVFFVGVAHALAAGAAFVQREAGVGAFEVGFALLAVFFALSLLLRQSC